MERETAYTDEEIQNIAEKVAKDLRNRSPKLATSEDYRMGPFEAMSRCGGEYNPLGRFPVEAEALTMKQKVIVTKIVGKGITELTKDNPNYEEYHRRLDKELLEGEKLRQKRLPVGYYFGMPSSELKELIEAQNAARKRFRFK